MLLSDDVLANVAATLTAALIEKDHNSFDTQYATADEVRNRAVRMFGDVMERLRVSEGNRSTRQVLDKARSDLDD